MSAPGSAHGEVRKRVSKPVQIPPAARERATATLTDLFIRQGSTPEDAKELAGMFIARAASEMAQGRIPGVDADFNEMPIIPGQEADDGS